MTDTEPHFGPSRRSDHGQAREYRHKPLVPRVMAKVRIDPDTKCWIWTGYTMRKGYACISWKGENWLVHRAMYTELVGDIPEGLVMDHLCEQKACCNPLHMEPVSHEANLLRSPTNIAAQNARKTHCPKGHEYTPENTDVRRKSPNSGQLGYSRFCITCRNESEFARQALKVGVVCDGCGWRSRRMPANATAPCARCGTENVRVTSRKAAA